LVLESPKISSSKFAPPVGITVCPMFKFDVYIGAESKSNRSIKLFEVFIVVAAVYVVFYLSAFFSS
jgi:hypothetical protein